MFYQIYIYKVLNYFISRKYTLEVNKVSRKLLKEIRTIRSSYMKNLLLHRPIKEGDFSQAKQMSSKSVTFVVVSNRVVHDTARR